MASVSDKTYTVITNRIVDLLEQGTVPWQQPWSAETGQPRNFFSQRPYQGINVWLLQSLSYASPFFATFTQIKAAGGSVRKGEHGCPVVFWKVYDGKEDAEGKREKRFVLKHYTVFNAGQLDGIAIPTLPTSTHTHTPIERCEKLVGNYPLPPSIRHGGAQAYYQPSTDSVQMPPPETFTSPERYYSTLFHELGHSTGHGSRLARTTLTDACPFGSTNYSKEELVAEMTATFACGLAGISNSTIDQSAAYIAGWLRVLRNDPKMVVIAAGQAQKAADHIQGKRPETADQE